MSALNDLNKAIAQGSEKARARALWHTCDVLTAGSYSEDDIWTFGEVIDRLAEEIESSTLAQLSERLAQHDNAPKQTLRRLAMDDSIEVAGKILQYSDRLDVNTLADGEPRNNFLQRALTWNPDGVLTGARHVVLGGSYAYFSTPKAMVIVDLRDPMKPKVAASVPLEAPRAAALQFRYIFVTTAKGLEVLDVTLPERARRVEGALVPFADARGIYVARTYAYIGAGRQGLAIVDVEKPETPTLFKAFDAGGTLDDATDVVVATTNASLFAYVADGKNGLKVLQLTSPDLQPKFYGFSPEPNPKLVAWRETASPARALAKGLDRDRAVDETGGQIAIFGRIGSRPFTLEEQRRFYLNPDGTVWKVKD